MMGFHAEMFFSLDMKLFLLRHGATIFSDDKVHVLIRRQMFVFELR